MVKPANCLCVFSSAPTPTASMQILNIELLSLPGGSVEWKERCGGNRKTKRQRQVAKYGIHGSNCRRLEQRG